MMKLMTTTILALGALAATSPAAAQYAPQTPPPATAAPAAPGQAAAAAPEKKIVLSKEASKAIIDLQKSVQANDAANIPAKLAAAKALAKSADDKFAIGQLQRQAATAANDLAGIADATEYLASSGYLSGDVVASLYNSAGIKYFNAKDFARAAGLFQKATAVDPKNADAFRLLGEATNSLGKPAEAAPLMLKALQMATAAGQKPVEEDYKRALSLAYNAKLPIAVDLGKMWIRAYPGAESWRNAIAIYRNMMQPELDGTLDLLRLQRANNALTMAGDYTLFASAAAQQGNFGEAQAVMDEGVASGKLDSKSALAKEIFDGLRGKPKPTAAELEASAKAAKTPTALMAVGNRFFGLGDYARAAELYRAAAAAGANPGLANLRLGMALARGGDKAGAVAALKAVTGEYAGIASYWLIHAGA